MEFFKNINYDFLAKKKIAYIFSGTIIAIGLIFLVINGGFNYNIDFTGGTIIEVGFGHDVDVAQVRTVVEAMDLGSPEVQTIGNSGQDVIIKYQGEKEVAIQDSKDISHLIIQNLRSKFLEADGYKIELRKADKVGPKIGSELRRKAFWAISLALLVMLIYVTFRFQFRFGIATIVALIHDILITLALFSIFRIEIGLTVVAALLTIVGYSINDTIVISDRIRENMKLMFRKSFSEIVNTSLNQVFSRTIITSVAVLIVVLAFFLFGGSVIWEFSLALIIGVIFGTYSSIFIVSPLVVGWEKLNPKKVLKK